MVTTVQVSDSTKKMLEELQEESKKTYDLIIRDLVLAYKKVPRSMAGKYPNLPKWTKEDRARSKYD